MQTDIKIYTLGSVKLEKDGETLVEGSSGLSKRWYLFMVLFFHSHETLSIPYLTEKVGMHENESPEQSLRMMVYRLRQNFSDIAEEEEIILTENGGYTFNSEVEVWLDIVQFEKLKARAEEHKQNNNREEAISSYRGAFELYRGPFMQGLEENLWILQQRKKYRSLYLDIVDNLTDLLREAGKLQEAEEVLEAALKFCPLETEIHNKMIDITREAENQYQARKRAEQSVTFFQRNGLKVPEKIEQHLKSQETVMQMRDPAEFIREKEAASEEEVMECSPLKLFDLYEVMKNIQKEEVALLNFKIKTSGEPGELTRAENVLKTVLKEKLEHFAVICHWQDGHYVVLDASLKTEEMDEFYLQVVDDFQSQDEISGVKLQYEKAEL